jgi:hypothetical protein
MFSAGGHIQVGMAPANGRHASPEVCSTGKSRRIMKPRERLSIAGGHKAGSSRWASSAHQALIIPVVRYFTSFSCHGKDFIESSANA